MIQSTTAQAEISRDHPDTEMVQSRMAGVSLANQIEIMSALSLLLRYAKPDLVGTAGELDGQRADLFARHKATVAALRDPAMKSLIGDKP